jgi:hypothetical protein
MGEEHDYRMRMIIKQSGAGVSREVVPVTAVGPESFVSLFGFCSPSSRFCDKDK